MSELSYNAANAVSQAGLYVGCSAMCLLRSVFPATTHFGRFAS
jgi:hypothetical protein